MERAVKRGGSPRRRDVEVGKVMSVVIAIEAKAAMAANMETVAAIAGVWGG